MRESHVWLRLIVKTKLLPDRRLSDLVDDCDQLMRILASSIVTAKRNIPRKPRP
jgi:hypothetical protein